MNPLACQIIARGSDSASQFYFSAAVGGGAGLYRGDRHYTWALHQLQEPLFTSAHPSVSIYVALKQRNASNN